MMQLVESVKERGVITPATVRQKEDGRYELISGHRRKRACELAGFETLRCEVVDLTRDEATILMVESNFQRSQILPSEKAFAYKMRLEAMKRQGERKDLTCAPVGHKLDGTKSRDILSDEVGESREQIRRYIRLTNLVPELLDLVDEGRMKMRPAVEISFLDEDCQRDLVDEIDLNDCTPSHDQTIRMRKMFEEKKLTPEAIQAIMSEQKPNQRERIVLSGDTFKDVLISGKTPYNIEEVDTAIRYVVPANQTAPVKWKEVTTRNFTNILKKFTVTVTKSDREEGIAQGDASLAGAVYGIYKGETLVDKYVTDKNGQFTTKEYVCDNDWTIREITPSEGYLLDTTIHKVGAEPQLYTQLRQLITAHIDEDEFCRYVIQRDINGIALALRETHKDDFFSVPEDNPLKEMLETAGEIVSQDSDTEQAYLAFICKRLKLNFRKLSVEERKWLKKIAEKSDLLKNPKPQRGRR